MVWYIVISAMFLASAGLHFLLGLSLPVSEVVLGLRMAGFAEICLLALILAYSGMTLQTLLQNPLAEPYLLGVSGGSSLGSVTAIFLSLSPILLYRTLFAVIGAMLASGFVFFLANRRSNFSIGLAILLGVACNALFSGLIMFIQSILLPGDLKLSINFIMGNIDAISSYELGLLAFSALTLIVYLRVFHRELDILLSGEEMALAVGVETQRIKILGFGAVSLSVGIAVSIAGMIGFVGLVIPHIVKMLFRPNHKTAMIPLFLFSATLLLLAMTLSRVLIAGHTLPIGVITSILGAPFFIMILMKRYPST